MCARRQSLYIIGTASCLLLNLNFLFQPKLVLFFQNLHLCLFVKSLICSLLCDKSFCLFLHWENHICAFLHSCALFWRNKSLGYLCSMRRSVLFSFIFHRNGDYVLLPEDKTQSNVFFIFHRKGLTCGLSLRMI